MEKHCERLKEEVKENCYTNVWQFKQILPVEGKMQNIRQKKYIHDKPLQASNWWASSYVLG